MLWGSRRFGPKLNGYYGYMRGDFFILMIAYHALNNYLRVYSHGFTYFRLQSP